MSLRLQRVLTRPVEFVTLSPSFVSIRYNSPQRDIHIRQLANGE